MRKDEGPRPFERLSLNPERRHSLSFKPDSLKKNHLTKASTPKLKSPWEKEQEETSRRKARSFSVGRQSNSVKRDERGNADNYEGDELFRFGSDQNRMSTNKGKQLRATPPRASAVGFSARCRYPLGQAQIRQPRRL